MRTRRLARWLVVGSLAGLGLFVGADIAFAQTNDNTSQSSDAESGGAGSSNTADSAQVGPAQNGDGESLAQEGDNEGEVSQNSEAQSADAVAGSQVNGIVAGGGSSVAVNNSNTSTDSEARSGDVSATNTLDSLRVGPQGSSEVSVGQVGDNEAEVNQNAIAISGDAVAGSQVTGIVASGTSVVDVANVNTSDDAEAESGAVNADNTIGEVAVGPGADIDLQGETDRIILNLGTEPVDAGGAEEGVPVGASQAVLPGQVGVAQLVPGSFNIFQEGDNEFEADQNATATSGDAVAGSQVTGLVASEAGAISVANRQSSEDDTAETGIASATNDLGEARVGPQVVIDAINVSDEEVITINVAMSAESDNELEVPQTATAATGDAVAGAQVTGAVASDTSSVVIALDNTSEDSEATSGNSTASNEAGFLSVGPQVIIEATLIEVGVEADAGDVTVNATVDATDSESELDFDQSANAVSGDAVAGGQVAGVVATADADVVIAATNVSEDAVATSGDALSTNTVATDGGALIASPTVFIDAESIAVGEAAQAGDVVATGAVSHTGDNELDFSQSGDAATGDAVAGAQVFGVVAAGDVAILASNSSDGDESTTGDSAVVNTAATDGGVIAAAPVADVEAQSVAFIPLVEENQDAGNATATATVDQVGDNELDFEQSGSTATGDAVAGAQVFGVVSTGGDVAFEVTSTSEDSEALTGDANVTNTAATAGGTVASAPFAGASAVSAAIVFAVAEDVVNPRVESGEVTAVANVSQTGDNELDFSQGGSAVSGDAVAGGNVLGLVGSSIGGGVISSTSDGATAESGDANVVNTAATDEGVVASGPAGVAVAESLAIVTITGEISNEVGAGQVGVSQVDVLSAVAGTADAAATVDQTGDNELDFDQSGTAATGDAVAGGLVFGAVTSDGGLALDVTLNSEDATAESGDATITNTAAVDGAVTSGPFAFAGALSDASILVSGDITEEGDGVQAVTFDTTAADVEADATTEQTGDNELDFSQGGLATSGDAVAGGGVLGVVATDGASVAIVLDITSEDDTAETGAATITNTAATDGGFVNAGAHAFADAISDATVEVSGTISEADGGNQTVAINTDAGRATAVADASQIGDNELDFSQGGSAVSGDAVAGGLVAGVVASDGAVVAIDSTVTSEDAEATSGPADVTNTAATNGGGVEAGTHAGAKAISDASATISGDITETGAGDQTLRINVPPPSIPFASIGPANVAGAATATATSDQTGDNELDFSHGGLAVSGDAVAGATVIGVVASGGVVGIVTSNSSDGDEANSGAASVVNTAATDGGFITSGTAADATAVSDASVTVEGTILEETDTPDHQLVDIFTEAGDAEAAADASQTGDNELDFSQDGSAVSGDAVAGGQVVGVVSDGAVVAIDASNVSEDSESNTGPAAVTNNAATGGGEIVVGTTADAEAISDASVLIAEDAVITGDVVIDLASGPATAGTEEDPVVASQTRDNELDFSQGGSAATGDAVAGGQVMGVVASGGTVAIVASNTSEDAEADSGPASVNNAAATDGGEITVGTFAAATAESLANVFLTGEIDGNVIVGIIVRGSVEAAGSAEQTGDNELDLSQGGSATSGDAVAGGQVFGVVSAGGDVAIDATNTSEDAESESGAATVNNSVAEGDGELTVGAGTDATAAVDVSVELDEPVILRILVDATLLATGAVAQVGDNELDVDQGGSVGTGDAVAGGQVTGVVASGVVDVVLSNDSDGDESVGGNSTLFSSVGDAVIGPVFTVEDVI